MSQQPFSSDNGFSTTGNVTASLVSGNVVGNSVTANSLSVVNGVIQSGISTVVPDGINSITTGATTQMDVYGFPFTTTTRGQVTISGATTPTEVNGVWYYQSLNTNAFAIYTDSTYSTPVDSTAWAAYTGAGVADFVENLPLSNIVLNANGFTTTFATNGNVVFTGVLNGDGSGLTNLPGGGGYGDANVVTLLGNFGSNNIVASSGYVDVANVYALTEIISTGLLQGGNIYTSGNISSTGNVIGAYLYGDGSNITKVTTKSSTIAGSNTKVTLNNITAMVGGTPTRLYIGAATSNITAAGDSQTMTSGSMAVSSWINVPIQTGAGNEFAMSGALTSNGDTAVLNLIDQGTGTGMWRVTGMIANTTANTYGVTIERLV